MDIIKFKNQLSQYLITKIDEINDSHGLDSDSITLMLEYPPEPEMGDVAFPCFKLSKTLRKSPVQIAQIIAENFACDICDRVEAVNGYLNIYANKAFYSNEVLPNILNLGNKYGCSDIGNGKNVVLEYSSPNVAKPFHIGHLGTTTIGHSLKLLHQKLGYNCIGLNYLGDWGTQFGKQITAYKKWGDKETIENGGIAELVKLYVKFHEESEKDPSLEDIARAEFTKLENGDEENTAIWKWIIKISLDEYSKTYKQLGIDFDSYKGESYSFSLTSPVVDELKEKGVSKINDGMTIVDLEEYKMPPCLILKSDGSTIYAIRDIAAALYRKETYNFDKCVYVTASEQNLHFAQWFKVLELMGYEWAKDQLVHISYGMMSINGGKLSTRSGNIVTLNDLLTMAIEKVTEIINEKNPTLSDKEATAEAVGVGSVVFNYLMNGRIKDGNFVMEDALRFEGNTGPYTQYTYARACSILERGKDVTAASYDDYEINTEETNMLRVLAMYPEKILKAVDEYEPSVITRYILDICNTFNRFYHECKIINADSDSVKSFRIDLTKAVKIVLGDSLKLICMKTPEKI
jgi:arginyl-tRNA synthetase